MDPSSSTKFHKLFAAIFQHTEKYIIGIITGSVITGMKCLEVKYQLFIQSILVNKSDFSKVVYMVYIF